MQKQNRPHEDSSLGTLSRQMCWTRSRWRPPIVAARLAQNAPVNNAMKTQSESFAPLPSRHVDRLLQFAERLGHTLVRVRLAQSRSHRNEAVDVRLVSRPHLPVLQRVRENPPNLGAHSGIRTIWRHSRAAKHGIHGVFGRTRRTRRRPSRLRQVALDLARARIPPCPPQPSPAHRPSRLPRPPIRAVRARCRGNTLRRCARSPTSRATARRRSHRVQTPGSARRSARRSPPRRSPPATPRCSPRARRTKAQDQCQGIEGSTPLRRQRTPQPMTAAHDTPEAVSSSGLTGSMVGHSCEGDRLPPADRRDTTTLASARAHVRYDDAHPDRVVVMPTMPKRQYLCPVSPRTRPDTPRERIH